MTEAMQSGASIRTIWDNVNRVLFWAAFAAFWVIAVILVQDAVEKSSKAEETGGPQVYELG